MWDELGIVPTDDQRIIRRAYAARLKRIDPDRDRDAFGRLRRAFEGALAHATRASPQPVERPRPAPPRDKEPCGDNRPVANVVVPQPGQIPRDTEILPPSEPVAPDVHASPPAAAFVSATARERALLIGLEAALQRRDAAEATKLYYPASATGALPLGEAERMLARVFAVALEEPALERDAFRDLARCFGWDRPPLVGAGQSDIRERVFTRLSAEAWYDWLVGCAEKRRGTKRRQVKVARLILRRIRRPALWRIDRQVLTSFLAEYRRHQQWLRDRIDPAWASTLDERIRRREIAAGLLINLFVGGILLQGAGVVAVTTIREGLSLLSLVFVVLAAFLLWVMKYSVSHLVGLLRRRK